MNAASFFALALRTVAYGGVMTARVLKEQEQREQRKNGPITTTAEAKYNPVLAGVIEWGQG